MASAKGVTMTSGGAGGKVLKEQELSPVVNDSNHQHPPWQENFAIFRTYKLPSILPINTLLFSEDARLLISGGDDETVYVLDTKTGECIQTLEDDNWGQITTVVWGQQELPNRENGVVLCIGTGRGCLALVALDYDATEPFPVGANTSPVFAFNDSVEKMAFDKLNNRLAVTSHSGEIKVFAVNNTSLRLLWADNIGKVITSGLFFFGGSNQSLLTIGLETSEMKCLDASKRGPPLWTKHLIGGIGSASLSSDETLLLVDNLATGNFDVYQIADNSPLRSLPIGSTRRFSKQCAFFEGSKIAVCGSDTNKVFIVDVANNYVVQTLTTCRGTYMTQTVCVTPSSSRNVFVAAACRGYVYIWEKSTPQVQVNVRADDPPPSRYRRVGSAILPYLGFAVAGTVGHWLPHAWKLGQDIIMKTADYLIQNGADRTMELPREAVDKIFEMAAAASRALDMSSALVSSRTLDMAAIATTTYTAATATATMTSPSATSLFDMAAAAAGH
uniref:Uncharacterized protein n=1 Tax=Psilocybe cubensis TaxID=181762 RepID=A0A8H8CE81_PSICU